MSAKLCIMTAYADETLALLNVLGQDAGDSVDWNSRLQFEWADGERKWVVMQSGMGKVRAASMCQMIIDTYQVDTFFEFGFAGGLVDRLNIGDMVVVTRVSEHDVPNRPEIQREQETWRERLFQASASSISRFATTLSTNPDVTITKSSVICGDMDIYDREVRIGLPKRVEPSQSIGNHQRLWMSVRLITSSMSVSASYPTCVLKRIADRFPKSGLNAYTNLQPRI